MIVTERLELIPATIEMLEAELRDPDALRSLLGVPVPASWPPDLYDAPAVEWSIDALRANPDDVDWFFHYFVRRLGPSLPRTLVGAGGYKGPPRNGAVEIGYSILPEHRRLGFASEATRGMVARAFEHPEVRLVVAHTLPDLEPSIGVLQRCGFLFTGPGEEEGTVRFELGRQVRER